MNELAKYVYVPGVALITSLVLTRLMIWLGPKVGMIDLPDARRIHKTPIPRAGGVAVFVSFHVALFCLFFVIWPNASRFEGLNVSWWTSFLIASGVLFTFGVWDDIRGMKPVVKLGGQVLASTLLFFLTERGFDRLFGLELPWWLSFGLTIVWCVALINAFNLIDGLDGLCSGLAIISCLGVGAAFVLSGKVADSLVVLALVGAAAGFLRYNFHPAKIFLGDTGSMFLGFSLAALALDSAGKSTVLVSIGVPFLAAGVPLMDTVLAIWRRSARRLAAKLEGATDGPAIMGADKEHLHHRLLEAGLSQRRVALTLYTGNVLLVGLGLLSIFMSKALVGLFLIVFIAGVYVVVRHVVHVEIWDTGRLLVTGIRRPGRALLGMIVYPIWDLIWMSIALVGAFWLESPGVSSQIRLADWIRLLPVWISPVFLMLVLGNTYSRVWSRSSFRDYLLLFLSLIGGVFLTLAFLSAAEADLRIANLRISLIFAFLSAFGVFGVRAIVHVMREWMISASSSDTSRNRYLTRNILLYGAGNRGTLYLRELRLVHPDEMATRNIVGFIDDNLHLRRRYVQGVQVVGTLEELEDIVETMEIDEVIVTADLLESNERRLLEICHRKGVTASVWRTQIEELPGVQRGGRDVAVESLPRAANPE